MKTTVEHLKKGDYIVGIRVTNTKDETFTIPIIDVRLGEKQRASAATLTKNSNARAGSKYFKPSYSWHGYSYND